MSVIVDRQPRLSCEESSVATNSLSSTSRHLIVLVLALGLFAWVFSDAIFRDRNFVYRDASQFYYPLLKLVQQEWKAGRWPLWNPQENAGMPLLGNPASAVLYPPRIVLFQWLPLSYAAAFKWYTLFHVLLCGFGAWLLARHWKRSAFAAGLAAISYAFAAVVMFQYCNVIFLVSAAWVPFGLLAADRAFETGDWRWAGVLGAVLALQVFGGDPQAAYITGGLAAVYLMMMDLFLALAIPCGIAGWFLLKRAYQPIKEFFGELPGEQPAGIGAAAEVSDDYVLILLTVLVLAAGPLIWWRCGRRRDSSGSVDQRRLTGRRRACLAIAAIVGLGISAVQWIPSWEFGRISNRAAGGVHYEPYAFWIAPWRFAEFLWPNVMGREFPIQSRWLNLFRVDDKLWEPSLYFGALPLLLALSAWGVRRVVHWQRWLSLILLLSLCAATGPGGGISWYWNARERVAALSGQPRAEGESAGSPKVQGRPALRMQTPPGGLYWLMLELLPGFDTFRYPAKLMTFAAIAFAILASAGWDRLFGGEDSRSRAIILSCSVASLAFAMVSLIARGWIINRFESSWLAQGSSYYGPLVASRAWNCIFTAFVTTAVLLAVVQMLWRWSRGRSNSVWISALVLALVVVDIALANKWMVVTAAQTSIDAVPKLVEILREAEAADSNDEPNVPFRIHRMSVWTPPRWHTRVSPVAEEEVFQWEKETIQPKHGLPFGIHYTINEGTLEPYDYWWFFAPFYSNTTAEPKSIVYYPQRGFDMWGARYFVLPYLGYEDQNRGFRTFLRRSAEVAHSVDDDYQVRRNLNAYPRAWIVHQLIYQTPIVSLRRADRINRMAWILYEGFDPLWSERSLDGQVQDPRRVAWIEDPDPERVLAYADPAADRTADRCEIVRYEPDRVEIEAETAGRGVMVFADLLYPGWEVTVDGQPDTILRVNRMMRGVPLLPGKHHIVFRFRPLSVRVGAVITVASLCLVLLAYGFAWIRAGRRAVER
jgi:hypothetical protein